MGNSIVISEVSVQEVQRWEVLNRNSTVSLCRDKNSYHVVLSAPRQSKRFVIYKSEDRAQATSIFNSLSRKLHVLANASAILDVGMVQNLSKAIYNHPTYGYAHIACYLGLPDLLSNANIARSINETDGETGKTPLHIALEEGKLSCVRKLLQLEAKVNLADYKGNIPLHLAARCRSSDILKEIASNCKHLINKTNQAGETALHEACLEGFHGNVEILLKYGANPSLTESDRQPIHCAVISGSTSCVESLIKRDHNLVYAKENKAGNSLLHLAKNKQMVYFLVELGCPIDQRNNKNQTPLLLRVQEGDFSSGLRLLIEGANASAIDVFGLTSLHLAIQQNRVELVKMLIGFGADVNQRNRSRVSPRHEAARSTGNNRDKILYCLHLAGAKRCSQQMNCSNGCSRNGNFNGRLNGVDLTNRSKTVVDEFFQNSSSDATLSRSDSLYGTEENERHKQKLGSRVLCLDGGGIRGLVTIKILMAIEHITGRPICESFDWIASTSTGGILAMGLLHGKKLNQLMGAYFKNKGAFEGTKSCSNPESYENFLKKELGAFKKMSDVQKPRVMLMATLVDRRPAELLIFRNYHLPSIEHESTLSPLNGFRPPARPENQLVWKALRDTSASPTYFKAGGHFIDGSLLASDPTLDVLSEIHKFNTVNKDKNSVDVKPLHVVISIGTGKDPLKPVVDRHSTTTFHPQGGKGLWNGIKEAWTSITGSHNMAAKELKSLLIGQSTQSEGQTVSRAAAWCNMIDVPYYRLNPQLSEDVPLDYMDDSELVSLLWETECFLLKHKEKLIQLANLLK